MSKTLLLVSALASVCIGCAPNARTNPVPEHAGTDGGGATVPVSSTDSSAVSTPGGSPGYSRSTPPMTGAAAPNEAGSPGGMQGAQNAPKPTHEGADHSSGHGATSHEETSHSSGSETSKPAEASGH